MMAEQLYNEILQKLNPYKGQHGLYIIEPKTPEILQEICKKLGYEYRSNIAYIGIGSKTEKSDLYKRSKQEMGWSNFEGATFVKKIGVFLDFNIKDKTNKSLREATQLFICSNFTIKCICFSYEENISEIETQYIDKYKPCLNDKKTNRIRKIKTK